MHPRKVRAWWMVAALVGSIIAALTVGSAVAAAASGVTRQVASVGTGMIRGGPLGDGALSWPEFAFGPQGPGEPGGGSDSAAKLVNRSLSQGSAGGSSAASADKAKSRPELVTSFNGLNHRDQRLANNGNQFSVEPPDQGLCAGNGYVLETVNDVLRVYDRAGNALVGVTDQNSFYGYAPAIVRPSTYGPFVTDPSCYFDADTQRWFHVALTLDRVGTTSALSGKNHLDLAVSNGASPLGSWTIYRLPVQDDGTDGTPNHGCSQGPCLGDYPHIGADANGFYITTNEYSFFGPEFIAAQLYAFPKAQLAAGAASVPVVQLDTSGLVAGSPGFTVWPATSPAGGYETAAGGTEYFLSSMAAEEVGSGSDTRIALWALSNTSTLGTAPDLRLRNTILPVNRYAVPPKAEQKPGDIPLGQCVNDTTLPTPFGPGCWQFLFTSEPAHDEVESHLDANDSRMQQVTFANGKVWGALDTAVTVGGQSKAGIGWYVVKPSVSATGEVSGIVAMQGDLALAGNNLTYPAIGVLANGRGVMAFTLVGADHYPSAAYAPIDASAGVGDIRVAAAGLGPSDGFTSYKAFVGNPPRTRWGDYGATAVDGRSVWIASEYIGQTCTFTQYVSAPFGSCGGTRTSLGNWYTRISRLNS
jgi:hypothetical protein